MDVALWILGIIVAGIIVYKLFIEKDEIKEPSEEIKNPEMAHLQMKVAQFDEQGKQQNVDYQIYIVSKSEYDSKTEEQIRNFILSRFEDKSGSISLPTPTGLGLLEGTYTTPEKSVNLLFLVVNETSQPVIDWKPKPVFTPYVFKPVLFLKQTDQSQIAEIDVIPEIDNTDYIQAQLDKLPKDNSLDAPLVIQFPEEKVWTEGNPDQLNYSGSKAVIYFKGFKNFIVKGGHFYTKAPSTPFGGNVDKGNYSHRRHVKFDSCQNFIVNGTKVEGSNLIEGSLLGSTPELTPDFWYYTDADGNKVAAGADRGSFKGAPAYQSYWEFEHAFDFINCQRFTLENISSNGTWGDGFCIGPGNEDFIIRNSHFRFTGRQGGAFYGCKRGLIENVFIDNGRRAGLDFEPNSEKSYANEIEVKDCKIYTMQTIFAAGGRGQVNDIHLHDNEYQTSGHTVVCGDSRKVTRRSNWTIRNNKRLGAFGSPASDMQFEMTDNILIENNINPIARSQSKSLAMFEDCTNVTVRNNESGYADNIRVRNSDVVSDNLKLTEI